jgi:hypothetical protein
VPNDSRGAAAEALGAPTEVLSEPELSRVDVERLVRRTSNSSADRVGQIDGMLS